MSPEKENTRSPEHLEAQRNRILDASEHCFTKYGFHAASMARIAEFAGISQGLAYRYFKNKSAIILAIIDRQLAEKQKVTAKMESPEDFLERIMTLLSEWLDKDSKFFHPVLFLEMSAEASRDPAVEESFKKADALYIKDFKAFINKLVGEERFAKIPPEEIEERFYALQCLVEGAAVLAARNRAISREHFNAYLRSFFLQLIDFDESISH